MNLSIETSVFIGVAFDIIKITVALLDILVKKEQKTGQSGHFFILQNQSLYKAGRKKVYLNVMDKKVKGKSRIKMIPVYGIQEFNEGEHISYFYSNNLSAHLESHKFVNSPHKHSTYIAILFTHGSGQHFIDFEKYVVKPGSVFLLNPGQVHSWNLSKDVKGYVFFHTKEFYNGIFQNRKIEDFPFYFLDQNYPMIELSKTLRPEIENLFELIVHEHKGISEFKMQKLGSLTDLLYLKLAEVYTVKKKTKKENVTGYWQVRKLLKLIDENFKTVKSPAEYADKMNMTIRHLNRISQEALKKSTGDLIFERIILEAKRLLIHTNISIGEVADQLGYYDYSYFIRLFKKKTGYSPKEFQQKISRI